MAKQIKTFSSGILSPRFKNCHFTAPDLRQNLNEHCQVLVAFLMTPILKQILQNLFKKRRYASIKLLNTIHFN